MNLDFNYFSMIKNIYIENYLLSILYAFFKLYDIKTVHQEEKLVAIEFIVTM